MKILNRIIKAFELLYKEKNNFKELEFDGSDLYRYSLYSDSITDMNIDLKRTLHDIDNGYQDNMEGNGVKLAETIYKPRTKVQSWTSKPNTKEMKHFNRFGQVLLHSTKTDNTVLDDDFTEFLKIRTNFDSEYEVVKITDKEKCDIICYKDTKFNYKFLSSYLKVCYELYKPSETELLEPFFRVCKQYEHETYSSHFVVTMNDNYKEFINVLREIYNNRTV